MKTTKALLLNTYNTKMALSQDNLDKVNRLKCLNKTPLKQLISREEKPPLVKITKVIIRLLHGHPSFAGTYCFHNWIVFLT